MGGHNAKYDIVYTIQNYIIFIAIGYTTARE